MYALWTYRRRLLMVACVFSLFQLPADAWDRSHATTFAVLPPGSAHPEGITTDSMGNFYVVTWDYDHPNHLGHLIVLSRDGKFQRRVEIAGASSRLGDISFQQGTGDLLVVDYGGKQVLKVDPMTGASSVFISIPGEKAAPNGMTFDKKGNIYLTDSFQGTVWRTGPAGGVPTPWIKSDLLISHGFVTPLGANGLAFDHTETALAGKTCSLGTQHGHHSPHPRTLGARQVPGGGFGSVSLLPF
jgi:DNA-binding beta-propeller fold protein YncE